MATESMSLEATQKEYLDAVHRGEERLKKQLLAIAARYDAVTDLILMELSSGYSLSFHPHRAQVLANASPDQLQEIEVSFPGLNLYFPKLDEDMGVDNMLEGRFGNDRWEASWAKSHPVPAWRARASPSGAVA